MTSKRIVSGKHSLTVRVDEETYQGLRKMAVETQYTVNELLAIWGGEKLQEWLATSETEIK